MSETQNSRVTQVDWDAAYGLIASLDLRTLNRFEQSAAQAFARHRTTTLAAKEAENAELRAKVEKLQEELRKAQQPQWFYFGEECDSDSCRFSIDEVISEDFEWDNKPEGNHVLMISGARSLPDIWVALHYYTEAEKDARNSDDEYYYTVHATEEEARAALTKEPDA